MSATRAETKDPGGPVRSGCSVDSTFNFTVGGIALLAAVLIGPRCIRALELRLIVARAGRATLVSPLRPLCTEDGESERARRRYVRTGCSSGPVSRCFISSGRVDRPCAAQPAKLQRRACLDRRCQHALGRWTRVIAASC